MEIKENDSIILKKDGKMYVILECHPEEDQYLIDMNEEEESIDDGIDVDFDLQLISSNDIERIL